MSEPAPPEIRLETPEAPVTVVLQHRRLVMHSVSASELDALASAGNSLHVGFFGVSFGTAIAFLITLLTVDIAGPYTHAGFVAALGLSGILSAYFGIRALLDFRAAQRRLNAIKTGQ